MKIIVHTKKAQTMRLFSYAIMASSALAMSGCLGVFEKQPERYNYVAGQKRAPLLNPMHNLATPPTQQGLNNAVAQGHMQGMGVQTMPNPSVPMSAPQGGQGALEPSPLYYYEQQNAGIASSPLATSDANAVFPTEEPAVSPTLPAVVPEPEPVIQTQPLAASEKIAPQLASPQEQLSASYPELRDVPKKPDNMEGVIAEGSQKADAFARDMAQPTHVVLPPVSSELMMEQTAAIDPVAMAQERREQLHPKEVQNAVSDAPAEAMRHEEPAQQPREERAVEEEVTLEDLERGAREAQQQVEAPQPTSLVPESMEQVVVEQQQEPAKIVEAQPEPAQEEPPVMFAPEPTTSSPEPELQEQSVSMPVQEVAEVPSVATVAPIMLRAPRELSHTRSIIPESRYSKLRRHYSRY